MNANQLFSLSSSLSGNSFSFDTKRDLTYNSVFNAAFTPADFRSAQARHEFNVNFDITVTGTTENSISASQQSTARNSLNGQPRPETQIGGLPFGYARVNSNTGVNVLRREANGFLSPYAGTSLAPSGQFGETVQANGAFSMVPGQYRIIVTNLLVSYAGTTVAPPLPSFLGGTGNVVDESIGRLEFAGTNLSVAPGFSPSQPILPNNIVTTPIGLPAFEFINVPGRTWVDPPTVNEYRFDMLSSSAASFTKVIGLPRGFANRFEILVGDQSLGFFGPDDSLDFTRAGFAQGVRAFRVRNIDPLTDAEDPRAFPIMLDFSEETASFTMTPVPIPEPRTYVMLALGLWMIAIACRRHGRGGVIQRQGTRCFRTQ